MSAPDGFERLAALSREAHVAVDADGTVLARDARAERLLALEPGANLLDRAAPGSRDKLLEGLRRAGVREIEGWEIAFAVRGGVVHTTLAGAADGDRVLLLVHVLPPAVHAALDRVSAMVSEVSDLNRLIVRHRNELARRVDAGPPDASEIEWMGHELAGAVEALRPSAGSPEARRALAAVADAAHRLAPPVLLAEIAIPDLIALLRDAILPLVPPECTVDVVAASSTGPARVHTDTDRLAMLVRALVHDAVERAPHGRLGVCLTPGEGWLEIAIESDGLAGLSQRAHGVARGLAESLGGRIRLEPGGVCTIALPG